MIARASCETPERPGLPLRARLRRGEICGGEQRPPQPYGRWYVRRLDRPHRRGSRIEAGRSTVYVHGELEPRELALFHASEIRLDPRHRLGATVEVMGHGIGFWSPDHSTSRAFRTYLEGADLLRLVVAAYAVLGGTALRATVNGWVEARDVVGQATTMGFVSPRFAHAELWQRDDVRNLAIHDAVAIAAGVRRRPHHRLALRDFHAAVLEPGDDAFVFAYRAVEGIRQGITPAGSEAAQWAAMHAKIGTEAADYKQLASVSADVRHGSLSGAAVRRARRPRRRAWLIELAREAVVREVESVLGRSVLRLGTS